METKYIQLHRDLKDAAELARLLSDTDDGGTCNFDSLELTLPRWNENAVLDAIHSAGLGGFTTTVFHTKVFVVIPPVSKQANARTRQAEKMRDVMKALGYSASVWYQAD